MGGASNDVVGFLCEMLYEDDEWVIADGVGESWCAAEEAERSEDRVENIFVRIEGALGPDPESGMWHEDVDPKEDRSNNAVLVRGSVVCSDAP